MAFLVLSLSKKVKNFLLLSQTEFFCIKECEKTKGVTKGVWDSLNLVDVRKETSGAKTRQIYKVTSTVVLELTLLDEDAGEVVLSGNLTKQVGFFFEKTVLNNFDRKKKRIMMRMIQMKPTWQDLENLLKMLKPL